MTVPIIGEVTTQTTEPAAISPSGVKARPVSTDMVGGGAKTWPRALENAPKPMAIASNVAEAARRIPHP
jgi:hypothetical protein